MLSAAVALVLLVACTNVAHLLIARGASRRREFAVRTALGAGRGRVVRQLVTESLILSATGCAGGVLIGQLALKLLVATRPSRLWELESARLDATTLFAAIGALILCGVGFGVLGAVQSPRRDIREALHNGSSGASPSRRSDRVRSLLVVSEMALSAMLLVGATSLLRSVINLQRTDVGFNPDGLYSVTLPFSEARYPTEQARSAMLTEVRSRLRQIAGIQDVVVTSNGAFGGTSHVGDLEIDGDGNRATAQGMIETASVETGYFQTMGVRILEGRTFADTSDDSREVILNAGFVRRHWRAGKAIGHRIRFVYDGREAGDWLTVVGVVSDVMMTGPVAETSAPLVYQPWSGGRSPSLMIRTNGRIDPVNSVRSLLRSMDPRTPPVFVASMRSIVDSAVARPRFTTLLLAGFASIAVILAAIGLYGMMAYSVVERTREIGIRVALGATGATIARTIVVRGVVLAMLGAMLGLVGAHWGMRLITNLLYGVTPLDPASFAVGAAVLIGAALMACVVPTRRALAVDPMTAIRAE